MARKNSPSPHSTPLVGRTVNQKRLIHEIQNRTLTMALGPAGTGKTYISTRMACQMFLEGEIEKIVVTRPMVMSEEEFGFLPGTLEEKYAPFFAPVREIMEKHLGQGQLGYMLKAGQVELAPVAFLRGHTFDDCFMILDEAQNMTPKQMKLFLTRIGQNTRVCLSGDLDQVDIEGLSGLQDAQRRLCDLPEVGVVEFEDQDVVRSGFVKKIIQRYK